MKCSVIYFITFLCFWNYSWPW